MQTVRALNNVDVSRDSKQSAADATITFVKCQASERQQIATSAVLLDCKNAPEMHFNVFQYVTQPCMTASTTPCCIPHPPNILTCFGT